MNKLNQTELIEKISSSIEHIIEISRGESDRLLFDNEIFALDLIDAESLNFCEDVKKGLFVNITLSGEKSRIKYLVSDGFYDYDHDKYYCWAMIPEDILKNYLKYFKNLKSLTYTSEFEDMTYDFLVTVPPSLKTLELENLKGLNSSFTKNIETIILQSSPVYSSYFSTQNCLSPIEIIDVVKNILDNPKYNLDIHISVKTLIIQELYYIDMITCKILRYIFPNLKTIDEPIPYDSDEYKDEINIFKQWIGISEYNKCIPSLKEISAKSVLQHELVPLEKYKYKIYHNSYRQYLFIYY